LTVSQETAVEKAERELQAAQEAGDQEIINEKQKALTRAQIEEDFARKRMELQYQADLAAWKAQVALAAIDVAQAPLRAFVSGLAAPWPLTIPTATAMAAFAATAAGIKYQAVQEAQPIKPQFADGGFVSGNSFVGDNIEARVNSGEAILNPEQQKQFMDLANGNRGGGLGQMLKLTIDLAGTKLYEAMYKASRSGELILYQGAVVSR
jgi:hypothetical protein